MYNIREIVITAISKLIYLNRLNSRVVFLKKLSNFKYKIKLENDKKIPEYDAITITVISTIFVLYFKLLTVKITTT